ncbi:ribosomal protein S18-alanine N-acetyltransferase [Okeania sp. SIO2G5]|uniref:ribosomal protein S18-alanine N-acetyltransferase n=1 Tax=Okeania sp. SIO2G5 TaxID=2607796 RepID=UPI0013C1FC0A|nr:ribosomal protein S18-alanine N-acetyltransferase [Okeania sp. SIO2G5]NEP76631.1 ribosomal protein S18-alanine N-acetyltransferase [Okeania sp. SIO2G5]
MPALFPAVIEELTVDDLSAVVQMDENCFGGLWTEAGYRREIESPNSQLLIVKEAPELWKEESSSDGSAEADGTDSSLIGIGCVWFILEEAHITVLAIQPPYRRQGLGQFLLITLLETAIQRQAEWATLEVRISNTVAQKLYKKLGFITIGQRKKYYQDTGEDALILWNKGLQNRSFHHDLEQLKQQTLVRLHKMGWMVTVPSALKVR